MIIAIDGTSASGKGTLGKRLQESMDAAYLDTGALYRTIGLLALQQGANMTSEAQMAEIVKQLSANQLLKFQEDPQIRTQEVAAAAATVAAMPLVRQGLLATQRQFAEHPVRADGTLTKTAILDGRDIGTVVCPQATAKIFLTASAEVRAQRRLKELQEKGKCAIYATVLSEVKARDLRDSTRAVSPLVPAKDAFVLDTSDLTADEVYEKVYAYIRSIS